MGQNPKNRVELPQFKSFSDFKNEDHFVKVIEEEFIGRFGQDSFSLEFYRIVEPVFKQNWDVFMEFKFPFKVEQEVRLLWQKETSLLKKALDE